MKKIAFGDMLSVKKGILVHGCNNHGAMNSGIAKQVRTQYPGAYLAYVENIKRWQNLREDCLGKVVWYQQDDELLIANGITQDGFGRDGNQYVKYKALAEVFAEVAIIANAGPLDIHYPLIGAGLGGGNWAIISDIIEGVMVNFPNVNHTLWIYE
jgi:O-acetyl-ADP-ribose deacetylase (regulator of RNase III)